MTDTPPTRPPTPAQTPRTDAMQASGKAHYTSLDLARTLERELTEARTTLLAREGELDSMSAALAAKDREIEAFKANNRYMRGHTAGYEEARSKFEPRLLTEEVLHKAARTRAEKAEAERAEWKAAAEIHQVTINALRAEVERLKVAQRERTQWKCACGGTDCEGQEGNKRLRAEVEQLTAKNHDITREWSAQVTQLRAALAAAQQDKERLLEVVREDIISANIIAAEVRQAGVNRHGINRDIQFIIERCRAAIDAARKSQP